MLREAASSGLIHASETSGDREGLLPCAPSQCWGLRAWSSSKLGAPGATQQLLQDIPQSFFYSFLGFVKPSALQPAAELFVWWARRGVGQRRYSWHFLEHTLINHVFISPPGLLCIFAEAFAVTGCWFC